jgi:hypothetical protein
MSGRIALGRGMSIERVAAWAFSGGWAFLVPYLLLFLLWHALRLPLSTLRWPFLALHAGLLGLLVSLARQRWSGVRRGDLWFWGLLALGFLLPGAYLEFPSDPWEHLRRMYEWPLSAAPAHLYAPRFASVFAWSWLGDLAPASRRAGLAAYGAAWQLLVAYQFHALARRLGAPRGWARAQVLGTVFFMGNSALAFYRYYALGPLPMAYVAYLRALNLGLDWVETSRRRALELLLLLAVMGLNHPEEVLLTAVSAVALVGYRTWGRRPGSRLLSIGALLIVLGMLASAAIRRMLASESLPALTDWGFWTPAVQRLLFEGLGLHGAAGVVLSSLLWRRHRQLALLTMVPVFLLLWPPVALAFNLVEPQRPHIAFRLLYAFPASFATVEVLRGWLAVACRRLVLPGVPRAAVAVLLLAPAALAAEFPWRGRLWFQLLRPAADLTLETIEPAARWMQDNRFSVPGSGWDGAWVGDVAHVERAWKDRPARLRAPSCILVTDPATAWVLATGESLSLTTPRRVALPALETLPTFDALRSWVDELPICGFLISEAEPNQVAVESSVGGLSGHWEPDLVRRNLHPPAEFVAMVERLSELGWRRTPVPPFYGLWEPPGNHIPGGRKRPSMAVQPPSTKSTVPVT